MITLYKKDQTVSVWPVDEQGWIAEGWSRTKPVAEAIPPEPAKPPAEAIPDHPTEEPPKDDSDGSVELIHSEPEAQASEATPQEAGNKKGGKR